MKILPFNRHLKMIGSRRNRTKVLFPGSPSIILSFCLVLVYLFSLARESYGVSLGGGEGEVVEPLTQLEAEGEGTDEGSSVSAVNNNNNNRKKRSRDYQQQLCGYRLLDALRNVCDRNFVGFTRRSDPSFMANNMDGGEGGQSGEDIFIAGANINPWDLAFMSSPPSGGFGAGGDFLLTPSINRDGPSILDYFELLPQQPVGIPPVVSSPWSPTKSSSSPILGGRSSSTKAIALKMLAEPPKTHQRFRRSIIDECCKKPCAMNQMLKYCAITAVGKRSF